MICDQVELDIVTGVLRDFQRYFENNQEYEVSELLTGFFIECEKGFRKKNHHTTFKLNLNPKVLLCVDNTQETKISMNLNYAM